MKIKFWQTKTPIRSRKPAFHPQTILREWPDGHAFRIGDALTGVCVFGATGSGKTSGPAKHLAYGYLGIGMGGVVLCAKPDERRRWEEWAADTGRTKDLIIIDAAATWRFNFLAWEAERPGAGGGLEMNIVNMLDELSTAISSKTNTKEDPFWQGGSSLFNTKLVKMPLLAGMEVSLPLLQSILMSAPLSPEQVNDPLWRQKSACWAILAEADQKTLDASPNVRADFELCRDYWTIEFPNLSEKTRSIFVLMFSMLVTPLLSQPLRQIFTADTNVRPEDTFDGKIIIVDIPVQEYRLVGRIANLAWKYCFEIAVLRRTPPLDRDTFLRPVFLWGDEMQNFVTKGDAEYQAVARSAGGCSVFATQNRESYLRVLGSAEAVDSLLGNLQAKFFCQNSGDTNLWAARLLGERWLKIISVNAGQSHNDPTLKNAETQTSHNAGISRSEQRRYFVEPATFTTLRRGGAAHNYQVECIVYNGGHIFHDGDEALPFTKLIFNQK